MATTVTDGTLFKKLMGNKKLKRSWIYDFKGIKVRGALISGNKIYFPKENRAELSKLDHSSLAKLVLSETEDENMFFLRPDTGVSDDIADIYS